MLIEAGICLLVVFFLHNSWRYGYWSRRNVFSVPAHFPFGSIKSFIFGKGTMQGFVEDIYKKYKAKKVIGFYSFYRPGIVVTDVELIKHVFVTDFNSFSDNAATVSMKIDPMFGINPFVQKGLEWKKSRSLHSAMHTNAKLKEMLPATINVCKTMINNLSKETLESIDVKEFCGHFTMDNVVACAFGLEPKNFTDPKNIFLTEVSTSKIFTPSQLPMLASKFYPKLGQLLSLRLVTKEAQAFFESLARNLVSMRQQNPNQGSRHDLVDHLMKYKQKHPEENKSGYTDTEIAGHLMTFYMDAYETSSTVISFFLMQLSKHPAIQERLREDILNVGRDIDDFDFEKVHSINYLEMTMNEILRIHPIVGALIRECTQDTVLGDAKVSKGNLVIIPLSSLHSDPQLFPDPTMFNPERFSEENKKSIVKYSFIPFGEGPRMCLGNKFGQLQMKMLIIAVLLHFNVLPEEGTEKKEVETEHLLGMLEIPKAGTKVRFVPL